MNEVVSGKKTKNIIVCCDGTANQFGKNNTNVAKIYEIIQFNEQQLNFYDPGVGTSSTSVFPFIRNVSNTLSQMFGLDLQKNVQDAYTYLMECYEPGDKIFLFGFSRGAHTVRRLADVLCKFGLLYKGSENMVSHLLTMHEYGELDDQTVKAFRNKFTQNSPVHFLGVWDTVSALSKLMSTPKLDGVLHKEIRYAYHAVSIDEMRVKFPANLFTTAHPDQTVEEVWFAGAHSDVGGSYEEDGLSNIALIWMIEKAKGAGLLIYEESFGQIKPDPLGMQHNSWEKYFKFVPLPLVAGLVFIAVALVCTLLGVHISGLYFLLSATLVILLIPTTKKLRTLPYKCNVHHSVKKRMDNGSYKPKNLLQRIESGGVEWV